MCYVKSMKTHSIIFKFVILISLLTACQPKDKAIVTPQQRQQIQDLNVAKKQSSGLLKLGSFGAAAFLIDQQAETLNWLMFLFNGAYNGNGYSVSNDKENNQFPLLQNNGSLKSNEIGNFKTIGQLELNLRKSETDQIDKISMNGQELNQFKNEKLNLSASMDDRRVVAIQPSGEDQLSLKIEKNGLIEISKADKVEKVQFQLVSEMDIKLDVNENKITVLKSSSTLKIMRTPQLTFKIESENQLSYQFNQGCVTATGTANIIDVRNSAKNKVMTVDDKIIKVEGTNWTYPVVSCENQVLIDLNKLLKY